MTTIGSRDFNRDVSAAKWAADHGAVVITDATADVHGMTVVTRNLRDFQPIGVAAMNPWAPGQWQKNRERMGYRRCAEPRFRPRWAYLASADVMRRWTYAARSDNVCLRFRIDLLLRY